MAFEPHPWFIGLEGVEHSAEVARTLAWAATSGASGIIKPNDLRVRATPVPGGTVRIMPGGFVVESTYSGASQQSYIERVPTTTEVAVPATGSSGGATRYVVAAILDPDYPGGGTAPAVPNDGVYAAPRVTTTLNLAYPHVPLARIKQPANTATITNDMITDLREVAVPRRKEYAFGRPRLTADASAGTTLSRTVGNGGEYFPGGNGSPNTFQVDVPSWATRVMIDADWMAVRYAAGENSWGRYWVEWGDEYRNHTWPGNKQWERTTQHFQFNSPGSSNNTMRTNWRLMDELLVPTHLRGKTCTFAFKAGRADAAPSRAVSMDWLSGLGMKLTFVERAVDDDLV